MSKRLSVNDFGRWDKETIMINKNKIMIMIDNIQKRDQQQINLIKIKDQKIIYFQKKHKKFEEYLFIIIFEYIF